MSDRPRFDTRLFPWVLVIAVIMICTTMSIASSLLKPIVIAGLAYLTLRPLTSRLCHFGLPRTLASGFVIVVCFLIVAFIATMLYEPIQAWVMKAPASLGKLRRNFDQVARPLKVLDEAEKQITEASEEVGVNSKSVEVSVKKPSMVDETYLISTTGQMFAFIGAIAVLAFFMLSTGDDFLNRVLTVLPDESRRHSVLTVIGEIQDGVGTYLSRITMINVGLGVAASIVMWAVGMPTPILWGTLAALLNFVPYIGPLIATGLVLLAASSTFDSFGRSLMTAVAFWSVTAIEGQFVTPSIVGKTLRAGPLLVLISVAFWGFLWGLAGVFLAVPLLIVQRQILANFDSTFALAVILGEPDRDPIAAPECESIKEDQPIADLA